ncbi:hypothetical protein CF65_02274 [Aggregatibacter actinomycetemcomitans HK1651]|nr:hypothetical protein CF65_02274 [Aggregatibacter actinomycetemcomitans HK1651]
MFLQQNFNNFCDLCLILRLFLLRNQQIYLI